MSSVQSVTCCCLLWLMLSVQLVTPGSPGTAHLPWDPSASLPAEHMREIICRHMCILPHWVPHSCKCPNGGDKVTPSPTWRKRSMAV
nr:TPA_inf: conotoxin precursor J [Conus ebraeus]